ncbi:FKBP-type peptidyl-prolyl cis-trans isomerase N-terminal domain-containing protein [Kosakonia sp. H02]|nr:FKBP-type peptidyl-prolyl cis-trans isomerase N-terminal domain-containing protein [Kosakonia sp. H02]
MRKLLYLSVVLLSTISASAVGADSTALLERLNKENIISVGPKSPFTQTGIPASPVVMPANSAPVKPSVAPKKDASEKEIRLLKSKLAASRREVQALRKKQAAAVPAKKSDEQVNAASHENIRLKQQLAEATKRHVQDAGKFQAISNENSQLQRQLKTSQQQLAEAKKQGAEQNAKLQLTATKTTDHVKQLTEVNKKHGEVKGQLDVATKKVNEQASRIATLEEKLKQSSAEKERVQQQLVAALAIPRKAEKEPAKVSNPVFSLAANKSEQAKTNYAWGIWFAEKVQLESETLKSAGQKFLPPAFLQGLQDKFAGSLQMQPADIEKVLSALNKRVADARQRDMTSNKKQGQQLLADAAKLKGAERAESGVVYLVEKRGEGAAIAANDVIRFKVDEKVSSGKILAKGEIHTGRVSELPPLMRAGVEKLVVGGRVRIYIPVELAYGEEGIPGAVPPGVASTMTLEVLSIEK